MLLERAHQLAHRPGSCATSQNWIGGNDYNPCGADFVPPPPDEVDRLLGRPLRRSSTTRRSRRSCRPRSRTRSSRRSTLSRTAMGGPARAHAGGPSPTRPRACVRPADQRRARRRKRSLPRWADAASAATASPIGSSCSPRRRLAPRELAGRYVQRVRELQERWRDRLRAVGAPRADAAAWGVIAALPAHPILTVALGVAATQRTRPAVANAIEQLEAAGVLTRLSDSPRNRAWEADGCSSSSSARGRCLADWGAVPAASAAAPAQRRPSRARAPAPRARASSPTGRRAG